MQQDYCFLMVMIHHKCEVNLKLNCCFLIFNVLFPWFASPTSREIFWALVYHLEVLPFQIFWIFTQMCSTHFLLVFSIFSRGSVFLGWVFNNILYPFINHLLLIYIMYLIFFKSLNVAKVRRLYDIANVLASLNLIEKVIIILSSVISINLWRINWGYWLEVM